MKAATRPGTARQRPPWRHLPALACALLASAALGRGLWIPAKARAAQVLIAHAWSAQVHGAAARPPWPWADTVPVARLRVARLGVERFVLAGTGGTALAFGPGHLTGSAKPGLAASGNVVFAGHRDTHFAFLHQLRIGDQLEIQDASGDTVSYRVVWTRVVAAEDTWVVGVTGHRALTLITCYPFGGLAGQARVRFVVRARAIDNRAASAEPRAGHPR